MRVKWRTFAQFNNNVAHVYERIFVQLFMRTWSVFISFDSTCYPVIVWVLTRTTIFTRGRGDPSPDFRRPADGFENIVIWKYARKHLGIRNVVRLREILQQYSYYSRVADTTKCKRLLHILDFSKWIPNLLHFFYSWKMFTPRHINRGEKRTICFLFHWQIPIKLRDSNNFRD